MAWPPVDNYQPNNRRQGWEPKFPEFAVDSHLPLSTIDEGEEGWHQFTPGAPSEDVTHVWGIRFVDGSPGTTQAKYGRPVSYLYVRFKDKRGNLASEYQYEFRDHAEARTVFEVMREMDHPGYAVWDELIRKAVDYRKVG